MTYLFAGLLLLPFADASGELPSRCFAPACSCITVGNSVGEARARSSAVFVGRVDSVESITRAVARGDTTWSLPLVRVRLQVLAAWPGVLPDSLAAAGARDTVNSEHGGAAALAERFVWVTTPASGPSCGFHFKRGAEYLVYADGAPTDLWTTKCSRTRPLWRARGDMGKLGPPSIDRRRR